MELQELVERIQRWKRKQTGEFEAASDAPETAYESGVRDDSSVPMVTPQVISSAPEEVAFEDMEEEETAQSQIYDDEDDTTDDAADAVNAADASAAFEHEEEHEQEEDRLVIESEREESEDRTENIDDLEAFRLEDEEQIWERENSAGEELPNLEESGTGKEDEDDEDENTR